MRTFFIKYYRRFKKFKARAIISREKSRFDAFKRVYHVHIRKCGGTSINASFWKLGKLNLQKLQREPIAIGKNWVFVRNNLELIEKGEYHYGNSHIPYWNLKLPKETFTFCMLRDPYSRLVSLYKYYLWLSTGDPVSIRKQEPYYHTLLQSIPKLGNCFSDFLDQLPEKHLQNQLYMFSEKMDLTEALKNVRKLHQVYFQSTFSAAITDLSQRLGVPLEVHRERSFNPPAFTISEEEKEKAVALLKKEYEFYGILLAQYSKGNVESHA